MTLGPRKPPVRVTKAKTRYPPQQPAPLAQPRPTIDGPESTNEIVAYFHCGLCLQEMPSGVSPREWSRVQAGWTPRGLQVWCTRHDVNICHIDLEGRKVKANTTRQRLPGEK